MGPLIIYDFRHIILHASRLKRMHLCASLQVAEACKGAGSGSVELLEMDAGSKESVTAVAKAVEGKARCPI